MILSVNKVLFILSIEVFSFAELSVFYIFVNHKDIKECPYECKTNTNHLNDPRIVAYCMRTFNK